MRTTGQVLSFLNAEWKPTSLATKMQVKIKEIGKTTNACMRRSPYVHRAAVIAGSPGPEHYCSLVAGSSLFTTGHWKSLSTPFLEPSSKCLMRQECRHNVKSKKKNQSKL